MLIDALLSPVVGRLFRASAAFGAAFGHRRAQALLRFRSDTPIPSGPFDLWFHCASHGEWETVQPVVRRYRTEHPSNRVLITFLYQVVVPHQEHSCGIVPDCRVSITTTLSLRAGFHDLIVRTFHQHVVVAHHSFDSILKGLTGSSRFKIAVELFPVIRDQLRRRRRIRNTNKR